MITTILAYLAGIVTAVVCPKVYEFVKSKIELAKASAAVAIATAEARKD